jgi:hypothetical protein
MYKAPSQGKIPNKSKASSKVEADQVSEPTPQSGMQSPCIDKNAIRYFATLLYGPVGGDSALVLSRADNGSLLSAWVDPHDTNAIVEFYTQYSANRSTYFGVGLRDCKAYRGEKSRGDVRSIRVVTTFYADIDIRGDGHKENALPETKAKAIQLVYDATRPLQPSIIVDTGGGIHPY